MNAPKQEDIEKRAASFRALARQMGPSGDPVEAYAESYEWMRADRDFWRGLAMSREPAVEPGEPPK